jgi:ribosomal protein S18 acetylase RimI-like enzyme
MKVKKAIKKDAEEIAEFFLRNVDQSYISYGDIFACGRATKDLKWVPNLKQVISCEVKDIVSGNIQNKEVLIAYGDENLIIGFAILAISESNAILEDLVVDRSVRGKGIGQKFYMEIETLLTKQGIEFISLESSINNVKAHEFFNKQGFKNSTLIMVKEIEKTK